jgi:secreted PhoX family phosphatase
MPAADRRRFLAASAAFAALAACGRTGVKGVASARGYGPLLPDPGKLLDLPRGFSYRVLSRLGDLMDDGASVPDAADGMGCITLPGGKLALIRNHELKRGEDGGGYRGPAFDHEADGAPLPGGTTTLVLDAQSLKVERQFRSLAGTIRNCAGGTTPWGSWLTCEEDVTRMGHRGAGQSHGWVFEVPAAASGPVDPVPLKAMGRFNHEAACVDPASGAVYLTEDRDDGLLYRFLPAVPGKLAQGGRLEALGIAGGDGTIAPGEWRKVRWIALDKVEAPDDDLRSRGAALGALPFARGEGIHMGDGELYFTCTSGGAAELGQVFRLKLGKSGSDRLQLFFESTQAAQFNYGDNLTIAPDGQLVICEDQYSDPVDNHLRGLTTDGHPYPLARVRVQTEPAGACFSPDGRVLFVNLYSPAMTLAVTGPWAHLRG